MVLDPQRENRIAPTLKRERVPLDDSQRSDARDKLEKAWRTNPRLKLLDISHATKPELRKRSEFGFQNKLVMAEYLKLIAEQLDPQYAGSLEKDQLAKRVQTLESAISLGMSQMLSTLRPREKAVHKIRLWKANSPGAGARLLDDFQTAVVLTPNLLHHDSFRYALEEEFKATNLVMGTGRYRSFLFLPTEELVGGAPSLIPYMRIANKLHFHIFGSLYLQDNKQDKVNLLNAWNLELGSVLPNEQEVLSQASLLANHVVTRKKLSHYGELEDMTVGLDHAFAAQVMTYIVLKTARPGSWYIPVNYPGKNNRDLKLVNTVDTKEDYEKVFKGHLNTSYFVPKEQDENYQGAKIFGIYTMFPTPASVPIEMEKRLVALEDTQARVTKNRIAFNVKAFCDHFLGGQTEPPEVQKVIEDYLNNLVRGNQIARFEIPQCKKNDRGKYDVSIGVEWKPVSKGFLIDMNDLGKE